MKKQKEIFMLVKDGTKSSYVAGGILQIILGLLFGFILLPISLNLFGIDVGAWYTLSVNTILGSVAGNYIIAAINFMIAVLFLINLIALFMRRSLSSTCFKLSSLLCLFMLGVVGLDSGFLYLGTSLGIKSMILSTTLVWILSIASGAFFILGFVFQFTLSKNSPNKATTYQMAKALVLLAIVVFNLLIHDVLVSSNILKGIFGYLIVPYFFGWYFLIMGIWQCISSPKLVDPNNPAYYGGGYPQTPYGQPQYPQQPYQQAPYQPPYPPQYQQPYQQPYVAPYPQQPYYGPRQGLSNGEKKTAPVAEQPKKIEEIRPVQQKVEERPNLPKFTPPKVATEEKPTLPKVLPPKLAEKQAEIIKQETKKVAKPVETTKIARQTAQINTKTNTTKAPVKTIKKTGK